MAGSHTMGGGKVEAPRSRGRYARAVSGLSSDASPRTAAWAANLMKEMRTSELPDAPPVAYQQQLAEELLAWQFFASAKELLARQFCAGAKELLPWSPGCCSQSAPAP